MLIPTPREGGDEVRARIAQDGGRSPTPPLTGRIRQKTDEENERKVKVSVHCVIVMWWWAHDQRSAQSELKRNPRYPGAALSKVSPC